MKSKIKKWLLPVLLVIEVSMFPVAFLYTQNIAETSLKEVLRPLFAFIMGGIIVYIFTVIVIRRIYIGALVSAIFIMLLTNFTFLEGIFYKIFPLLKYWHFLPILIVAFLHLAYFLKTKLCEENAKNVVTAMAVAVSALLFFNCFIAIPTGIKKVYLTMERKKDMYENINTVTGQPNIYYMIFDECASFYAIDKYYNYHDTTFRDFLTSAKFEISENSRNESGNTDSVLTNCINLNYVVSSNMSAVEQKKFRETPALYQLMENEGYVLKGIGETDWLNLKSVNADKRQESQTVEGFNFEQLLISNTFVAPFFKFSGTKNAKLILDSFGYLQNSKNITPNNSEMNLLYLCTPHQPFLFDKDGKAVSPANYNNWTDEYYYLSQYIYITSEIQKSIKIILNADPDCIILLTSDHGPRFNEKIPYEDKLRILNAVYYQGKPLDKIQDQSVVNTLRIVLNELFNMDMPFVEVKDGR